MAVATVADDIRPHAATAKEIEKKGLSLIQ